MIACVDVDYRDAGVLAACVCFQHWDDGTPVLESAIEIRGIEPYEPGQFYRRELPCILAVLQTLPTLPQIVIIDGYVWLGEQQHGLGARLYEALDKRAAVIGVAKTRFVTFLASSMPGHETGFRPADGQIEDREDWVSFVVPAVVQQTDNSRK